MDHIQNRPMDGRSIVDRENVNSLSNDHRFSLMMQKDGEKCFPSRNHRSFKNEILLFLKEEMYLIQKEINDVGNNNIHS